ncbi:cytochrome-c peroxidase [Oceanomicrobium pacificus]|uniref:C-type cytochrome n=1 Tax=Oceanomicrobium pacificus TaxID=2692916 RepID=A0A6B0TS72_9RHOB|nr:cytochrome c peroxidase [Oceanomicrobium pacificus]MXU64184.1 c-type cytochrome [Oceanomicrobium pacificus]
MDLRAVCTAAAAISTWIATGLGAQERVPVTEADFLPFNEKAAAIGQLLFYDPILSGNRNISCGTCHHHDLGTGDGLSLGIGEGGFGLGPERRAGTGASRIRKRVPRNAPALWNLGAWEVEILFHDGRVSISDDFGNGFNTPAGGDLPDDLDTILAAQALFPLNAQFEMAGNPGENDIAGAAHDEIERVWDIVSKRVRTIPAYADMFIEAFDDVDGPLDITISHIGTALGDFENSEWRSYDSPYDAWLAGDDAALGDAADRGRQLFFGEAGCADCHSGPFLSDQQFHALGLPAFGPGRTRVFDPTARDVGRMAETDRLEDAYRFRTPQLRNVALTAPYGHNGAYATLEGIVRHHLDPKTMLAAWMPADARLPRADWLADTDFVVMDDARERDRHAAALDIVPRPMDDTDVAALVAFLESLTGTYSITGRLGRPDSVPSGLPVD